MKTIHKIGYFLIRLTVGWAAFIILGFLMGFLSLCSKKATGRALIKTGINFSEEQNQEEIAEEIYKGIFQVGRNTWLTYTKEAILEKYIIIKRFK